MPVVGETGVRGTRGDQGESAKSCNCNDDTYYKKVMEHITLYTMNGIELMDFYQQKIH